MWIRDTRCHSHARGALFGFSPARQICRRPLRSSLFSFTSAGFHLPVFVSASAAHRSGVLLAQESVWFGFHLPPRPRGRSSFSFVFLSPAQIRHPSSVSGFRLCKSVHWEVCIFVWWRFSLLATKILFFRLCSAPGAWSGSFTANFGALYSALFVVVCSSS
jgi:hypothetical protein